MEAWNPKEMSELFLAQEDEAIRYCKEAKDSMYQSAAGPLLYDKQWARFFVFNVLRRSAHVASREKALLCLNQMIQQRKPTPFGACDGDYFESQRLKCIHQLIAQYGQELPIPLPTYRA